MSVTEQLIEKIKKLSPEAQAAVLAYVDGLPARKPLAERLLELSDEAARRNVQLPPDFAENHDHYFYGTSQQQLCQGQ